MTNLHVMPSTSTFRHRPAQIVNGVVLTPEGMVAVAGFIFINHELVLEPDKYAPFVPGENFFFSILEAQKYLLDNAIELIAHFTNQKKELEGIINAI